jgi:hypothetical protein
LVNYISLMFIEKILPLFLRYCHISGSSLIQSQICHVACRLLGGGGGGGAHRNIVTACCLMSWWAKILFAPKKKNLKVKGCVLIRRTLFQNDVLDTYIYLYIEVLYKTLNIEHALLCSYHIMASYCVQSVTKQTTAKYYIFTTIIYLTNLLNMFI